MKKIVKSIYNRQIKNNAKWCILRYPTEGLAQASNIRIINIRAICIKSSIAIKK